MLLHLETTEPDTPPLENLVQVFAIAMVNTINVQERKVNGLRTTETKIKKGRITDDKSSYSIWGSWDSVSSITQGTLPKVQAVFRATINNIESGETTA